MTADRRPRPTRTNWQNYVFTPEEGILEKYGARYGYQSEQNQQEEPGFFDRAMESVKAVGEGLTFLPGGVVDTVQDVVSGFDPADKAEMAQRAQREQEMQAYQQKYAGQAFEGITDAMASVPYSLTTMGAGLLGGVAGGFAGPVGAGAGAMAASGTTAYRASKPQFQRTLYQATTDALGREPSPEEWGRVESNFEDAATRYGLWEAGPEAISNLLMVKILGPLGSKFKGGVKDVIKSVAGLYGEELATETITQMGQGAVEAEIGLREKAPGVVDAFTEVGPATFWQTTLMAGGKKGLDLAFRRTRGNGQGDGPVVTEEQTQGLAAALGLPSGERLALGPGQNIYAGTDSTGMDPIPMPHGPVIRPGETTDMLALPKGLGQADFTVTPGGRAFSSHSGSLPDGEYTVTPYSSRPALTDYIDTEFDVIPYLPGSIPGQAQLARGTGAIQMPMDDRNTSPGTPDIEASRYGTLTTPYTPIRGLPAALENAQLGPVRSWSGGKSQLAYGPKAQPAIPMQAPSQPVPSIPAAQQILNVQPTPRADTTAQAQALGIPAPDPMPAPSALGAGASAPSIPAQSVPAPAGSTPAQSMPTTMPKSRPLEHMSQSALLAMLPQPMQKVAKGKSKRKLVDMVRNIAAGVESEAQSPLPHHAESGIMSTTPNMEANDARPERQLDATGRDDNQDTVAGQELERNDSGSGGKPAPVVRNEHGRTERSGQSAGEGKREVKIKVPGRNDVQATYEVMEATAVRTSHLPEAGFQKNKDYSLENERRYHDEPGSRDKVFENAMRLDPAFLLDSLDANHGAPVVDHDGNVLGGNGRAMSVNLAYEKYPERAQAYRTALSDNAARLGIDIEQLDGMERPVLVRRTKAPFSSSERQALVSALNEDFKDKREKRAEGKSRGDRLSRRTLAALANGLKEADSLRQYFDDTASLTVVDLLLEDGVIQRSERNAYVGADGLLNPDGKTVVEQALRGRIADKYESLAGLSSDILGKIDAAIPHILIAESVGGQWDITPYVRAAVDMLSNFRRGKFVDPAVYLRQLNMISAKAPIQSASPQAVTIFEALLNSKKSEIVGMFAKYAGYAQISPEAGGLGLGNKPQREAFTNAFKTEQLLGTTKENEHADLNSRRSVEPDRQRNADSDRMGEESFFDDRKRDGRIGSEGSRQSGEDVSASRGAGLSGYAAVASGKRSDSEVDAKASRIHERTTGSKLDSRSSDNGEHGLDVQRNREEKSGKPAERGAGRSVAAKGTHLREVQDDLPDLYPGQQEDVVFAEKRFRDGPGVMFTNGTGTGKTGLALGIISRLERAGRRNILISVPADKIGTDWANLGGRLGVTVTKLKDTKDAGSGITITTHANMAQNDALFSREWDLIVIDEAHKLSSSQQGGRTELLDRLRGLSLHPRGVLIRAAKTGKGPELTARIATLNEKQFEFKGQLDKHEADELRKLSRDLTAWQHEVDKEMMSAKGANRADISRPDGKKPGVLFLSATPFAYEKSIDYAEGYLFDYPEVESKGGYNQSDGYEQFMIEHFGYRMRYGKLTMPDSEVDSGIMQRQFNSWLKKQGALSSRNLDTPFDYDRRFILTENAIGQKIDEGLDFLREDIQLYDMVYGYINKKFDHLAKRYLLEAIKAKEAINLIRENVRLGRKVVVFHQFNKGGGFNPFDVSEITPAAGELYEQAQHFAFERPDLVDLPLDSLSSPVATLKAAFPDARVFSGLVSKKEREAAVRDFQKDDGGADVIIVQADAGEAGLSLHDTTGRHQRVLINLGLPTKPVTAIQQEGRIFRAGQQSNAMFRYLNTGTNWERLAFAQTIAQRASAAENLAVGEEARGLRDSFIQAFSDSGAANIGIEGEGTDAAGKRSLVTDAVRSPSGLAFDEQGTLFIASYATGDIVTLDKSGELRRIAGGFSSPTGLLWSKDRTLLVANRNAEEIVSLSPDGTRRVISHNHKTPVGLAQTDDGSLWVSCYGGGIDRIDSTSAVSSISAALQTPGVGIIADGNAVLVVDYGGTTVSRVDRHGNTTPVVEGLRSPVGLVRMHDDRLMVGTWVDNAAFIFSNR